MRSTRWMRRIRCWPRARSTGGRSSALTNLTEFGVTRRGSVDEDRHGLALARPTWQDRRKAAGVTAGGDHQQVVGRRYYSARTIDSAAQPLQVLPWNHGVFTDEVADARFGESVADENIAVFFGEHQHVWCTTQVAIGAAAGSARTNGRQRPRYRPQDRLAAVIGDR